MNRTFISSVGTVLQRGPVPKNIALQDFSPGILKQLTLQSYKKSCMILVLGQVFQIETNTVRLPFSVPAPSTEASPATS